ncbi:MAG: RNA polymerase II transcription factor B subunit 1 [Bogoriella megaspora]|nr:MAG: RNA polymerase II transcription factor B subunit 1 [Bogoriella megaspora]
MAFRASYKKQPGTLTFSAQEDHVTWSPAASATGAKSIKISIKDVTNLQRTPPSSDKRAVMVSIQQPEAAAPEKQRFDFTSSSAADDQEAFTEKMSTLIKNLKTQPEAGAQTAPMSDRPRNDTQQSSSTSQTASEDSEDQRLIKDVKLQEALTRERPNIARELRHAITNKAQSVSLRDLTQDFWSSRLQMLRSFAAEHGQKTGQFNVFSQIRARTVEGESKIDLPAEVIEVLFEQHPVVKRAYRDLIPKAFPKEVGFWRAFLNSKLYKKLRGENTANAQGNAHIDKYLEYSTASSEAHIPRYDDLEGNEQNHSQRKGNQADITMRNSAGESLQTLRSLNNISQVLMSRIDPNEAEPIDLELHDLEPDESDNRIMLNIKDQALFSSSRRDPASEEAALYEKLKPRDVANGMHAEITKALDFEQLSSLMDLGENDEDGDEDEDDDEDLAKSRAFKHSTDDALQAFRRQRLLEYSTALPDAPEQLTSSHQTLIWTLKRFWTIFQSGDALRANELQEVATQLASHLANLEKSASSPNDAAVVAPTKLAVKAAVTRYRMARETAKAGA